ERPLELAQPLDWVRAWQPLRLQASQQPLASPLALPAGRRAYAAVLHVPSVHLALVGAGGAGLDAGTQLSHQHPAVAFGEAGGQRTGRRADVCAVEVEADAAPQVGDVGLG